MKSIAFISLSLTLFSCESYGDFGIQEVRLKNKIGPEYRYKDSSNSVRWTTQTGVHIKHNNGWTTGITYRHRWQDEDIDDAVWFEFSIPLYDVKKKRRRNKLEERIKKLEGLQQ